MLVELFEKIVTIAIPHRCIKCTCVVEAKTGICTKCWAQLTFISSPLCAKCGIPFAFDCIENEICGKCIQGSQYFDMARSLFMYDEHSAPLLHKLKYGDKMHIAAYFAKWLSNAFKGVIDGCDLIVSVPMHQTKLRTRFFNQSALIANHIAKICKKPSEVTLLTRVKYNAPQAQLSKQSREQNIVGAFSINARSMNFARNKKILLVDDVYTTGATARECSKVLRDNGAHSVTVLTVAITGI